MKRLLLVLSLLLSAACSGGASAGSLAVPDGLTYAQNPATYVRGQPIVSNVPSLAVGVATAWEVEPALPAGLTLNVSSGVVSGTPTELTDAAAYVITAANSRGPVTVSLTIAVVDPAPTELQYARSTVLATRGVALEPNAPTTGGGTVASYTIAPALPAGLSLDATSGVLSGTPTSVAETRSYTVTAVNSGGSTTAVLTLTVNDASPMEIAYAQNPAVYTVGQPIEMNVPAMTGGPAEWTIVPALPAGLALNAATGTISGVPVALAAHANYAVTATNSGGSASVVLSITVNDAPPAGLSYAASPAVFMLDQPIVEREPLVMAGGMPVSWSIAPTLPPGLSFDATTGILSGTPRALSPATPYVITATNTGGSATTVLNLAVVDRAPFGIAYRTNPASFTLGQAIEANIPSNQGGAVIAWTVAPALPGGLQLDARTGVVSGVPSTLAPGADYVVTGTNSGGAATVNLFLTVADLPPASIAYTADPLVATMGQPVNEDLPTQTGGTVVSWSIAPPLPAGMFFDGATGHISGTPTALAQPTTHTITATNSGGTATGTVTITVNEVPPSSLAYTASSGQYTVGLPIPANAPTNAGGAIVQYAVAPPLPAGLTLSAETGILSGTPTEVSPRTTYVVTGQNSGGSAATTLTLTVNDSSPAGLAYPFNPAVWTVGQDVSVTPTLTGGAAVSWTVAPSLPAGLVLNAQTGVISGAPSTAAAATNYVVTAINSGGTATVVFKITVNDLPPAQLSYTTDPAAYQIGQAIPNNTPQSSGGAITGYSILPSLPAGLTMDGTTGVISGTPTVLTTSTRYTVTGRNSGGTITGTLVLSVVDAPPTALTFSTNPAVYVAGVAIHSNTPSSTGGAVLRYAVTPPLPAGLSLNTTTGILTGTPTQATAATDYTVTATNGGGTATATLRVTVLDAAPSNLAYATTPIVLTVGRAMTANNPRYSGGTATSWTVTPALPAGLVLDANTGVVSGTPSTPAAATVYKVTASNAGGSTDGLLTITVNDAPPTLLRYATNPAVFTLGSPITPNAPSSSGGAVTSYAVSPTLPLGLQLDSTTGIISGTPTALAAVANFTVIATNSGGSATTSVSLTVVDVPPSAIVFATNPASFTLGQAGSDAPTASGGAVVSWSVTPSLPVGVTLKTGTGVISGTPLALSAATTYTVTATNTGGSTSAPLTLAVVDVPPSNLSYGIMQATYTKGTSIQTNNPTVSGGAVISYSVSPILPAGLTLNTTNGAITGKPTVVSPMSTYTVTATNTGGSTTVALRITVLDTPPLALTYSTDNAIYTKGEPIADNVPSRLGGAVLGYTVAPPLPAGLALDPISGVISGTPTQVSSPVSYAITGSNSAGATVASIVISVVDAAPAHLTYATNPATFTVGQPITNDVPSSDGGNVLSYAILPAPPQGLSFNTASGVLSGTPTVPTATAQYQVTARNNTGTTTAVLTLTVNDIAPANLRYPTSAIVGMIWQPIATLTPTVGGGAVTSWTASPPLPAGLTLNYATGALSGAPIVVAPVADYTITAANAFGSTSTVVTITVNNTAPFGLTYSANPAVFSKGTTITNDVPSSLGGAVESWAINPGLPSGLQFSTATGVVSGASTVLSPASPYVVTATNSGGSATVTLTVAVNDVPPSSLSYATSVASFTVGQPIPDDFPGSSGGAVLSYAVSPALPAGLSLNTTTGVISGTPTAVTALNQYVVTATNSGGSTTTALTFTVNDVPPSFVTYPVNPATYVAKQAITANVPTKNGGAVVSWSIAPPLPAGLSFSTITGAITGTPTNPSAAASYTVTATNTGGSTTASLSITVQPAAPAGITYANNPATYTKGFAITSNTTSSTGGAIASWSVSPALPAGLFLDPTSGLISGTPTTITSTAIYVVTGTNVTGSATVNLSVTVKDVAPPNLNYTYTSATFTLGQAITDDVPSSSGGPIVSYAISPALPTGLTLNTTTGIISGTPSVLSTTKTYTVTATNTGGSATKALSFTVNDVGPFALSYTTNPATYTALQAIASNTPVVSGGAVVSWSVSPALPTGLTMSTTTGIITGTPTGASTQTTYTITATNTGGSTTVGLSITVLAAPPAGLTYSANPAVFTVGTTITNDTPSSTGGAISSYSISPSLPLGLSFSTSTGVISGTPVNVSAAAQFTVTAFNATGSTSVVVTITVKDIAPSSIVYSYVTRFYVVNNAIPSMTPTSSGGVVVSWSISPALPTGLSFDTTTGTISGTPTAISAVRTYTVTATNSGGSSTGTISLAVSLGYVPGWNGTVAAGYLHTCAISNGGAWCWGGNSFGQLGTNANNDSPTPIPVTGLGSGVQSLVAGALHTCALVNGAVYCWGDSTYGQLGNGSTTGSSVPVPVTGLSWGVQAIAAADGYHTCALVNGGLQCWGRNTYGQLGNASTTDSAVPVAVSGLGSGVQAVSAGGEHTCAIAQGAVTCWGDNAYGELGNGTTTNSSIPVQVFGITSGAQGITAGGYHSCAVVNGAPKCWGNNNNYQLGNTTVGTSSSTPVAVTGATSGATSIAAGDAHTCAIITSNVAVPIMCWGNGSNGQLGNGSVTAASGPVSIGNSGPKAVFAGNYHTCALMNSGLRCWGNNSNGQVGNATTTDATSPTSVAGFSSVLGNLAGGSDHGCAIVNGGIQCWGANTYGQLGTNNMVSSATPTRTYATLDANTVSTGSSLSCGAFNGSASCWGLGTSGQLGNGSTANVTVPGGAVTGLSSGVQSISAGSTFACALVNGAIKCWGANSNGQNGSGSGATYNTTPVTAVTSGGESVSAGGFHACAIVNGGVRCWGYNGYGQLGNNTLNDSASPIQVTGLTSGVQSVVTGTYHSCALVNGGVQCWGRGNSGQMGNGSTTTNNRTPVSVSGLSSGVQAIFSGGGDSTCALLNGGLWCWGSNSNGQLGDNSITTRTTPVQVSGLSSGVQLAGVGNISSYVLQNGTAFAWGGNASGQLGTGTSTDSLVPVAMSSWLP